MQTEGAKKLKQEKRSRAETSQAAWLLLNCLVSSSIHCSMVGWRRKHSAQLASPHGKQLKTSHMTTESPRLTFSLEWMNVSRTNDVLSWKIEIVTNVFTDAKITSQTWKKKQIKKHLVNLFINKYFKAL